LRIDERLELFSKVCEAVQYEHNKGVVHRDLKPGNILVTAEGTPKLLDFGIAKMLTADPSYQSLSATQTGTRCMTPAYASPEQMRGRSVTAATDIYSLGVVLYELLSGHHSYRLTQHTPAELERAICEQDPETRSRAVDRVETDTSSERLPITKTPELVSQTREGQPEKLRRRLRGDLDKIVLKALQKEPERRYRSVESLSHDIAQHLHHLPLAAGLWGEFTVAHRYFDLPPQGHDLLRTVLLPCHLPAPLVPDSLSSHLVQNSPVRSTRLLVTAILSDSDSRTMMKSSLAGVEANRL
jgi:serine/threonine protein kinase